jgi:hypothetical protein
MITFILIVLEARFAVTRLPPGMPIPAWARDASFASIVRTHDELSIISPEEIVPSDLKIGPLWRCVRVAGQFDFAEVGVLAVLATSLAGAGIPLLANSTFDTDYLLVKVENLAQAVEALRSAGHEVLE